MDIPTDQKTKTGGKPKQPKVKTEVTGKKIPSLKEEEVHAIKEKVTLQRIRNSQLRDSMRPTVPDQGIIFDENNNPWLKPDFAEENTTPKQNNTGGMSHNRNRGAPDDGDDPSDDDNDDNKGNGKWDPFTPGPGQEAHQRHPPQDLWRQRSGTKSDVTKRSLTSFTQISRGSYRFLMGSNPRDGMQKL